MDFVEGGNNLTNIFKTISKKNSICCRGGNFRLILTLKKWVLDLTRTFLRKKIKIPKIYILGLKLATSV